MNKAILYCVFFLVLLFSGNAQIVPPYIQTFDSATCTGWSHGPVTVGSGDNWQRGVSFKPVLNFASSPPNVWATNLTGVASNYSIMYLQTPSFDLSNLTKVYLLNFAHIYYTFSYHGGNIESSIDNGVTWQLLNTPTLCINWYNNSSCSGLSGQPSWSGSNYTSFMYSTYRLSAFQGQPNVKFRFQYGGLSNSLDGWVIDDFSIVEDIPNVIANRGATCEATKFFSTYTITSTLTYNGFLPGSFSNTTNYYFSTDSILTVSDPFIGSKSQNINSSVSAWTQTFTMVPNLKAGNYYIFYNHDANNNLTELNENDNTNYTILRIDSTFGVPDLNEDFEGTTNYWAPTLVYPSYWKKGLSNIHQAEGAHSGINSWFIDNMKAAPPSSSGGPQYFVSPYFDNSSANNNVICFWYRSKNSYPSAPSKLQLELSGTNSNPVYTSTIAIPMPRFNDWDCNCQSLSALNGQNNAKIRFTYNDMATYSLFNQNMNVDDIYMGQPKPDLSIEHKHILSTPSALTSDTMYYELFNGGAVTAGTSTTEFYWSNDSLLDLSDILLTSVSENTIVPLGYLKEKFLYTKPTTAQGVYFIIYKVDKNSVISEIWENNNIGYYKIRQDGLVSLPYFNDFETQSMGWWHYASIGKDNWQRSAPSGTILTSAFSGSFAFNTTQFPKLSAMSRMHLYTPIFDLTTISNPVMEFDMKLDSDGSCTCFEGKTNMSYSTDGGYTWIVLDTVSSSGNKWYLPMYFDDISGADRMTSAANFTQLLFAGSEPAFTTFQQYNSRDIDENTRYIIDISSLTGKPHVQFRFNTGVAMNDTTVIKNTEGAVIDNFRIRNKFTDLGVNYKKFLMMSGQDQTVKFDMFIKNNGNYISSGFANKFYLSVDTALDLSDFYLGKDSVFYLKPDRKSYRNESFLGPSNLSSYKYLLYQIDANNNVIESNKTNNIGYWPLALDSIASYPYLENFNDTIVHGWHEYTINSSSSLLEEKWRSRNILVQGDEAYSYGWSSGQMFTDPVSYLLPTSSVPYWYLESPSFNFTGYSNLALSFNMMVIASSGSGGNFQFSTNGGNTWSVLQPTVASQAYNWHNSLPLLSMLFNEPGWTTFVKPVTYLDSAWFDLSFLTGQPNVVFRFQFRSNASPSGPGYPQGMRIDNFRISGTPVATSVPTNKVGYFDLYTYNDKVYANYDVSNDRTNQYTLSLVNMLGQICASSSVELVKGGNAFQLPSHLANGVYLVTLSNGDNIVQKKVTLLRN